MSPVITFHRFNTNISTGIDHCSNFRVRVSWESVYADDGFNTKFSNIFSVTFQILKPFLNGAYIFSGKITFTNAAVHFQSTDSCYKNHTIRLKARFATFYVKEFLRTKIGTETRFCDHIVGQFKRRFCCHHSVTTVGNIGKRPAMYKGRVMFQRLD